MVSERRRNIKCVVVGDDSVGKTSMLMGYATCRYPTQHVPPVFDNFAGKPARHLIPLSFLNYFQR